MPARRRATSPRSVDLRPRKLPRQERSRHMNEVILEAAVRVLRRQGATAFTTTRVAEAAGISVGSLYQYYPNKASLLFRLHEREDERTWGEIEEILEEVETPPRERAVRAIDWFFQAEAAEAELRRALQDAAVLYRDSPEFGAHMSKVVERVRRFVDEAWPPRRTRGEALEFAAHFVVAVMSATAEEVTSRAAGRAELRKWSRACSAMLCDHFGL
jgi:AcrR family transcriptional regulator